MAESIHPFDGSHLARIEPDDRLVVLARTIQARGPGTEAELKDRAGNWARFGKHASGRRSIGIALYFGTHRKRPCGAISN